MNLNELTEAVAELGLDPRTVVVTTRHDEFDSWAFNIVPHEDGTFSVWQTDGRDGYNVLLEDVISQRPRVFRSESEVADWVWAKLTVPVVQHPMSLTPAEVEENRRRIEERFLERRRAAGLE